MLKPKGSLLFIAIFMLLFNSIPIAAKNYARRFCSIQGYTCIKARRGDTWRKLWPNKATHYYAIKSQEFRIISWAYNCCA